MAAGIEFLVFAVGIFVMGWKYWHGAWLNTIAGNTFASEEELASPEMRTLGRRVAVLLFAACAFVLVLGLVQMFAGLWVSSDNVDAFVRLVSIVGSAVFCVAGVGLWAYQLHSSKQVYLKQMQEHPESELLAHEAQLNALQARTIGVFLVVFLVIFFGLSIVASLS